MSTHRPRRIGRSTAEQILRGEPAGSQAGPDVLVDLLAAAAAPAAPGELAGERAALAAFRAARLTPVHEPRRRQMIKTTLAKLLTVKAAAGIAAATAAGGVAFAASTGALPNPLAAGGNDKPAAHATGRPSPDASHGARGNASPSPSMVGLCHAYTAAVADNPGKALDNPAFTALITTAGGKDQVTSYCTKVLADAPGNAPTAKPGKQPTGRPSGAPTDGSTPAHPDTRPSEHATAPTPRPSH